LAWILLNSLPKTTEWRLFVSQTVNSVAEGSKLTLSGTEQRILAEIMIPTGNRAGDSALATKGPTKNCTLHGLCYHETKDCRNLKKGDGGQKAESAVEDENSHYVTAFGNHVSKSLAKHISAYTVGESSEDISLYVRVLDTGASTHM
ncbi:hypothetical protein B0H13DRAFT_1514490, partial [Mycena leptocephala]